MFPDPPGSEEFCCTSYIVRANRSCGNNTAPCVMPHDNDKDTTITTTTTTTQSTTSKISRESIATQKAESNNIVEMFESNWVYIFLFFLAIVALFCCIVCGLVMFIYRLKKEHRKVTEAWGIGVEGDSRSRADSVSMTDIPRVNTAPSQHSHISQVNINVGQNDGNIKVFVNVENDIDDNRRYSNSNSSTNEHVPVSSPDGPQPGFLGDNGPEPDHYKMPSIMSDMYASPKSVESRSGHEGDTITGNHEFFGGVKMTTLGQQVGVMRAMNGDTSTGRSQQIGGGGSGLDMLKDLNDPNTRK